MSIPSYPVRIPASVFTNPQRRKSSVKSSFAPMLPLKSRTSNPDDVYVPRSPTFTSIAYLREALSAIDVKLVALAKERAELETKLETAVRLQSPVLRLPSELLSSIFTRGVLEMADDPIMVPTLMLVCRYWAEVALNTPLLWAKISISPHDSIEKARRRLMRSKSCPLELILKFGSALESVQESVMKEYILQAMELFRPALWRIKSFSLTVPRRSHAYMALLRFQEDAPMLETLNIQVQHALQDSDHYSKPRVPLFNGCTPNLRSCAMTAFNFDQKMMNNLRFLKLGGYFNSSAPSAATLLSILRQSPEIEEFTLRNTSDIDSNPCSREIMDDLDSPITSRIHLPRLKKLSFYCSGANHTREVMRHISFPNLESLELAYLQNAAPLLQLVYSQALTRLPLKVLRLDSCLFSEMAFVNLLRKLPSLVTLDIVDTEDITHLSLKALCAPQPWVCPHLTNVTVEGCTSFDWDSLRAFVESRLPADPHAYKRYHSSVASIVSSASAAAADYARMKSRERGTHSSLIAGPQRIMKLDVTGCNQISWEMVQWLRMYVASVKCESTKGLWVNA